MNAEVLRRAASLMRERAEAATEGPWIPFSSQVPGDPSTRNYGVEADAVDVCTMAADVAGGSNTDHIASWHPAVALAMADWLDAAADYVDLAVDGRHPGWKAAAHHAVAVARAYLGEQA